MNQFDTYNIGEFQKLTIFSLINKRIIIIASKFSIYNIAILTKLRNFFFYDLKILSTDAFIPGIYRIEMNLNVPKYINRFIYLWKKFSKIKKCLRWTFLYGDSYEYSIELYKLKTTRIWKNSIYRAWYYCQYYDKNSLKFRSFRIIFCHSHSIWRVNLNSF